MPPPLISVRSSQIGSGDIARAQRNAILAVRTRVERGQTPYGARIITQSIRRERGITPEQLLANFRGDSIRERMRSARDELAQAFEQAAKREAPKSASPVTGGQMAAGIRVVNVNANTVEVSAPAPALWRIRGFPETGGLRPWLIQAHMGDDPVQIVRAAKRMLRSTRLAATKDYDDAAKAGEEGMKGLATRKAEIEQEHRTTLEKMVAAQKEPREIARAAGAERAAIQQEIFKRQRLAGELEERHKKLLQSNTRDKRLHADVPHIMAARRVEAKSMIFQAQEHRNAIADLRSRHEALAPAADPVQSRRLANEQFTQAQERLGDLEHEHTQVIEDFHALRAKPVQRDSTGQHYRATAARLMKKYGIGNPDTKGRNVPIYGTGSLAVKRVTLQDLLGGAFRYPRGYDFFAMAQKDPSVVAVARAVEVGLARRILGGRPGG